MKAITFEAGGKEYALRFDINAMARYQERAGEGVSALMQALVADSYDILRARRAFWAAISPRMTEDEAGDLMAELGGSKSLELVGAALLEAIRDINGSDKKEADAENPKEPRSEKAT